MTREEDEETIFSRYRQHETHQYFFHLRQPVPLSKSTFIYTGISSQVCAPKVPLAIFREAQDPSEAISSGSFELLQHSRTLM